MAAVELGLVSVTLRKDNMIGLVQEYVSEQTGIDKSKIIVAIDGYGQATVKFNLDEMITNLKSKNIPAFQEKTKVEI